MTKKSAFDLKLQALFQKLSLCLGVDMNYLTKNSFWLTIGQIVASISSLVLAVIFARFLPKEVYGSYKFVLSIVNILAISTLTGINTYTIHAIANGKEGSLLPAIKLKVRYGLLGLLGGIAVAIYYFLNKNAGLGIAFLVVSPFVPLVDTLTLYNSYLQGTRRFRVAIGYFSITQIVATIVMAGTTYTTSSLPVLLGAYFGSWTVLRAFFLFRSLRRFPPNKTADPQTRSYGMHLSAAEVLANITQYLDGILLFHFLGAEALAVYAFSMAPVEQMKGLFKNIIPVVLPKFSRRSFQDIYQRLYVRMSITLLFGITVATAYILLAPSIYRYLFPTYTGAVFFSQLLALTIAVRAPLNLLTAALQSKLRHFPKSWIYWGVIPHVVFLLLLLLVPVLGILGAVTARLASLATALVISIFQWERLGKKILVHDTQTE